MRESFNRRVVITGCGMITALGKNTQETFDCASRGMSGIDYITAFYTTHLHCRIGGQVNTRQNGALGNMNPSSELISEFKVAQFNHSA